MLRMPPLLDSRDGGTEFALVVVGPIVLGAIAGLLLGSTKAGYLIVSLVAILGGVGAGLEHATPLEAVYRGLFGGTLYGVSILTALELSNKVPKTSLPHHQILLVSITAVGGAVLGVIGSLLRRRATRQGATT
jgi:hypothetical protein